MGGPSSDQLQETKPWYGVRDPRQRKKIQDRLAQRARRRRLAESKIFASNPATQVSNVALADCVFDADLSNARLTPDAGQGTTAQKISDINLMVAPTSRPRYDWFSDDVIQWEMQEQNQESVLLPPDWTVTSSDTITSSSLSWISPMASDHHLLPVPTMTIYAALYKHGELLGISCDRNCESKSPPAPLSLPKILHPTATQLTRSHRQWIDRFPFPRMRDNLIKLDGAIDYEEFVADLFVMTSFTLKSGWCTWNPEAWVMGKEFGLKWSYLFN